MMENRDVAVTAAELNDLIDGRVAPAQRRCLIAKLRRDPAATARLWAYRAQIAGLVALYGAAAEPVPARLTALIDSARALVC
jgi:anti-sigma factor RsiW